MQSLARRLKELFSPTDSKRKAEAVRYAYRLILGRDPGDEGIRAHINHSDLEALRRVFFESQEFRHTHRWLCGSTLSGHEPPLSVQDQVAPDTLERLFTHIQTSWRMLGEQEPYWSVISVEEYKSTAIKDRIDKFYQSGAESLQPLLHALRRNGLDESLQEKDLLEYGCGVGRVTHVLAGRFNKVYAYDVSESHLRLAKEYAARRGIGNVEYRLVQKLDDILNLPQIDLAYSIIVLQHNPPPIIRLILESMLSALRPGGVAFFQLLTYQEGYSFNVEEYLRTAPAYTGQVEMHVLPQRRVFEVIESQGCRVLEVLDDALAGYRQGQLSNTFLVQKRQA